MVTAWKLGKLAAAFFFLNAEKNSDRRNGVHPFGDLSPTFVEVSLPGSCGLSQAAGGA